MNKSDSRRGERNFNPGNIRHNNANKWKGMADDQPDKEFVKFKNPFWGIRALAILLLGYQKTGNGHPGLKTVREMISRWAPSSENDTSAYIQNVADQMDVLPNDEISLRTGNLLMMMTRAIIKHENGRNIYADEVFESVEKNLEI